MKKIPLFVIEEHHEAFFIWNYAGINGLIEASGNTLLHVDQHADTSLSRYHMSIKSLTGDLQALCKFTYGELCVGDFIPAAIYQGLFKELYWLQHQEVKLAQTIHVYSYNQAGKALRMTPNIHEAGVFSSDRKSVTYGLRTVKDEFPYKEAVVLDIDLDYFSCDKQHRWEGGRSSQVEITKEEYERFTTDRYHPLRINVGGVKVRRENGRYYLLVNAFSEVIQSDLKVSQDQIIERIDSFAQFLRDNSIQPQLIDICRSRFSGFTSEDQWEFIEKALIEKLSTVYDVELSHIGDILVQESLTFAAE